MAAADRPAAGAAAGLEFDGTGYVSIPGQSFRNLQSGTVAVWFRPTGRGGTLVSSMHNGSGDRQFPIYAWGHEDGTFSVAMTAVTKENGLLLSLVSDNLFSLDAWHHLVYSSEHGSGTFHVYVDGKPRRMHINDPWSQGITDFFFADTLQSADNLQFGAKSDSRNVHGGFFQGTMRDLMIFERALRGAGRGPRSGRARRRPRAVRMDAEPRGRIPLRRRPGNDGPRFLRLRQRRRAARGRDVGFRRSGRCECARRRYIRRAAL